MIPYLDVDDPFPPVDLALRDPNGLLAAGADLSPERLIDAYARGIFPWFNDDDPVLWWSPDPRMVLPVNEIHVSRSLRRTIKSVVVETALSAFAKAPADRRSSPTASEGWSHQPTEFRVSADTAFAAVVAGCAEPRPDQHGTWITKDMASAYARLFSLGYAHSIETWWGETLVGGLYGVAIGRMFFGESMFARRSDASKVALVLLARQLARWGFEFIDCQMSTAHLASLGAREISRVSFVRRVRQLVREPGPSSPWRLDLDLAAL